MSVWGWTRGVLIVVEGIEGLSICPGLGPGHPGRLLRSVGVRLEGVPRVSEARGCICR